MFDGVWRSQAGAELRLLQMGEAVSGTYTAANPGPAQTHRSRILVGTAEGDIIGFVTSTSSPQEITAWTGRLVRADEKRPRRFMRSSMPSNGVRSRRPWTVIWRSKRPSSRRSRPPVHEGKAASILDIVLRNGRRNRSDELSAHRLPTNIVFPVRPPSRHFQIGYSNSRSQSVATDYGTSSKLTELPG